MKLSEQTEGEVCSRVAFHLPEGDVQWKRYPRHIAIIKWTDFSKYKYHTTSRICFLTIYPLRCNVEINDIIPLTCSRGSVSRARDASTSHVSRASRRVNFPKYETDRVLIEEEISRHWRNSNTGNRRPIRIWIKFGSRDWGRTARWPQHRRDFNTKIEKIRIKSVVSC